MLTTIKEGDLCWYDQGPGSKYRRLLVRIIKHGDTLSARFKRSEFMEVYHDCYAFKSDWGSIFMCKPITSIELLTIMSDPEFDENFPYWNDESCK